MSLRRSSRLVTRAVSQPAAQPVPITTSSTSTSTRKRKTTNTGSKTESKKLKTSSEQSPSSPNFKQPSGPVTPARSKRTKPIKTAPPITPTPSLVNVLRAPYSTGDVDDSTPPPPTDRPADPHRTNATLITPGGTQARADFPPPNDHDIDTDTDKCPIKQPPTTTTLLHQAQAHLIRTDPRFAPLIAKYPCAIFSPSGLAEKIDPFRSLTSGICGQQVSGAAAKAIKNRFVALFNEGNEGPHIWPTTKAVSETSIDRLRSAGLSQRKAEYIRGLAEMFVSGELSTNMLLSASDEDVMEKLIAVRGLGKWSVEMFACFGLKRMDILSTGDLGVQRGMAAWFGKDVAKLKAKGGGKWKYMGEQEMLDKSEAYRPWRSLFMWYMWRVEDVDTAVLEGQGAVCTS